MSLPNFISGAILALCATHIESLVLKGHHQVLGECFQGGLIEETQAISFSSCMKVCQN